MKRFYCIIIFITGMVPSLMAQSYYGGRMPDAPGAYKKPSHTTSRKIPGSDNTKMIQMMDAVIEVLKKSYPQPVGADIIPYGGIWENYRGTSEFSNSPYTVYITIPFYDLYQSRSGGTEASGEYTSSIEIWINSAKYILQGNGIYNGNDRIFRKPRPGIEVGGFPKYNNMVLILPPGKRVPWRPATRQEYLENFIQAIQARGISSSDIFEMNKISRAQALLSSMSTAEKNQIAYLQKSKYMYAEFGYDKWNGFRDASDTTAEELVIPDENYYDKSLPKNSFQFIVIERRTAPASISASAPTKEGIKIHDERQNRVNSIVRSAAFLTDLQKLLGKTDIGYVAKKTTPQKFVPKKLNTKNIDRIADSIFRNYKVTLPPIPAASAPAGGDNAPVPELPVRNEKKLLLAARKLNTREELIRYIDELDSKVAALPIGSNISGYNDPTTNNIAAYGYYLFNKPKESLLLAVKAAKQQPDNNTIINNLAAELSLCGIEYMATPLYIVCLKKEPDNSTLTNNIGQAWLGLGDLQQAETYLKKAIASSPYHHHANNSLGLIYQKQGRKDDAIRCYENSLRGSFTLQGFNGLKALKRESAMKLMNYIRNRYHQPDYINFNKIPIPPQCTAGDQIEIRKLQHEAYQKEVSKQEEKYYRLRSQEEKLAAKSFEMLQERSKKRESIIRPFQPFATAVTSSLIIEFKDKLRELEKDLLESERKRIHLQVEFDTVIKQTLDVFEPRLDALGEGNPDPSLDEDICEAENGVVNHYLPLFAEINEERFNLFLHTYKGFLNDYLYWVRLASSTEEEYQVKYYDILTRMYYVLKQVRLTTLEHYYCKNDSDKSPQNQTLEPYKPDCPLPVGVEIPFVIGKLSFDCESWGIEGGEGIVINIDHKIGSETTIAFGPGLSFYSTPKIGKNAFDISPGIDAGAKGQFFITFDGNMVADGGFLWEAEIDFKGLGKPAELKQNFTWAIVKGFTYDGLPTTLADKAFGLAPETQVNKNVNIYNPK